MRIPRKIFDVDINKEMSVNKLKKEVVIMINVPNGFKVKDLNLWQVNIPLDTENNKLTALKSKSTSIDIVETLNSTKLYLS
ncbi:hypothetical protein BC938DRAFT_480351 [Jimgerdemannia flammicorona]|uniref:Crinkler effector protein N-terminal domain-containing protein n=1 Tax=Jimgerdemannia flammicorona TaxID=994334 RepID=A0A433QIT3_9FUNG|nr:hypothetical protein BC938DRAFT_480351 [Jimgerdemannia flammicorona]